MVVTQDDDWTLVDSATKMSWVGSRTGSSKGYKDGMLIFDTTTPSWTVVMVHSLHQRPGISSATSETRSPGTWGIACSLGFNAKTIETETNSGPFSLGKGLR
ncbi:hypothetical protein HZ326_24641 [Fusarium oxysporum f. sp. albedinis]|nr:hypothetical protein HZ326_24641 [Fusarium oxysporum f. sp. albedinis]